MVIGEQFEFEKTGRLENGSVTDAAYDYVESIMHTADDKRNFMWHGWALREAFIAGVKYQKERC